MSRTGQQDNGVASLRSVRTSRASPMGSPRSPPSWAARGPHFAGMGVRNALPGSDHSSPLSARFKAPSLHRALRQGSALTTGFCRAVLLSPLGTAIFLFEAPRWTSTSFDPTLGFPGEGPDLSPHRTWRFNSTPEILHSAFLPSPGKDWRRWALGTLQGDIPLHPDHFINRLSTTHDIHLCLLALAETGNSPLPIAARIQSRPRQLHALLGKDEITAIQARGGSAYNFMTRPFQHRRPRTIRLDNAQQAAVSSEIWRLHRECKAVEYAPPHDGDKTILKSTPE
jgi:hypothetical protein